MQNLFNELDSFYQVIINAAADAIIVIDRHCRIKHFSSSAERLFGYSADQCLDQNINMLIPEQFKALYKEYFHFSLNEQDNLPSIFHDIHGRKKSGSVFPMRLSVGKAKLRNQTYLIAVCHDLTSYEETLSEKIKLESLQNALFDAAVDGIITVDDCGIVRSFNNAAENLFGYPRAEVIGQNVSLLMPAPYAATHDHYIENYKKTGHAKVIGIGRDAPGKRKDGSVIPLHLSVGEAHTNKGKLFIGICHDLTPYQTILLQLAQTEKRYKDIVENQKELICRLNNELRVTFANHSFMQTLECQNNEIIGLPFLNKINDEQGILAHTLKQLFQSLATAEEFNLKIPMHRKNGIIIVNWWFRKIADSEEFGEELQGFGIDISQQEEAWQTASYLRDHDILTGLLYPKALIAKFEQWKITHATYAVIHFDYNRFNLINQKYGQQAGDRILIEMARRIESSMLKDCLICRPGSDDIVVVAQILSTEDAYNLAECLLYNLEQSYQLNNDTLHFSAKAGISIYPTDDNDIEKLLRLAESAVPRNINISGPIAFFDAKAHAKLKRQLEIEQGLRRAMLKKQLQVYLQPQVNINSLSVTGYEALLRWTDDVLGVVSPAEFFPVAERMNLGSELDKYVLKQVMQQLAILKTRHYPLMPVAINITAKHFGDKALYQHIISMMRKFDIPLHLLQLEITENALLDLTQAASDNLLRLRQSGIKIAIDDFGTGYSSLGYLKNLSVDILKIDKTFIDAIDTPKGKKLAEAIIQLAKAMELEVIAEGIETQLQADLLSELGCFLGQGYLFARPQPMKDVLNPDKPVS